MHCVIAVAMIERLIAKRGARIVSAAGEGTDSDDPSGMLMRSADRQLLPEHRVARQRRRSGRLLQLHAGIRLGTNEYRLCAR